MWAKVLLYNYAGEEDEKMDLNFTMRRPEDKVMLALRSLYELFGYRKYKVSNFEEYSLYLQYKSFLSAEKILSFTDLDGRLLALRPDVTLSIIKNAHENETAKAYYIEKVYRESKESNTFKEINQMGLEFMGRVDAYALAETVLLAQKSLQSCAECVAAEKPRDYILELGHMGFVMGLLEKLELLPNEREEVIDCLAAKSPHRLQAVMQDMGLSGADKQRLLCLADLAGPAPEVLQRAETICSGKKMQIALQELQEVYQALDNEAQQHIRLDFSLLNATEFYDGILFSGYLDGLPRPLLSGGRYDSMMYKLGHDLGAIGFAVYLDELERLPLPPREFDVDVWLEPRAGADIGGLLAAVRGLTAEGQSVRVAAEWPAELRARRHLLYCEGEGLKEC